MRFDMVIIKGADCMEEKVFDGARKQGMGQIIMTCNKVKKKHWLRNVASLVGSHLLNIGNAPNYLFAGCDFAKNGCISAGNVILSPFEKIQRAANEVEAAIREANVTALEMINRKSILDCEKELNKAGKKLIGYKLKDKKYNDAALKIISCEFWIKNANYHFTAGSHCEDKLREFGVLDLWCEPVYEEKPKRWRAKSKGRYWVVSGDGTTYKSNEDGDITDDERYNIGNYFKTEQEAEAVANKFKALLSEHHKQ